MPNAEGSRRYQFADGTWCGGLTRLRSVHTTRKKRADADGRTVLTNFGELLHGLRQVSEILVQDVRHHLQRRVGHGVPANVGAYLRYRGGQPTPNELVGHRGCDRRSLQYGNNGRRGGSSAAAVAVAAGARYGDDRGHVSLQGGTTHGTTTTTAVERVDGSVLVYGYRS